MDYYERKQYLFRRTGEFREPRSGELYETSVGYPARADHDWPQGSCMWILTAEPIAPAPAPGEKGGP